MIVCSMYGRIYMVWFVICPHAYSSFSQMSERINTTSVVDKNEQAHILTPPRATTRVLRPASLSGLPLGRTQDLSTVLREVHRVSPPAPPPVDRTRKKSTTNIPETRELRPRTQSLDYKKVNKGSQYPSWRFKQ